MTRRLWLINLLMLALLVAGVWQVRKNYLNGQAREQAFLNQKAKAEPAMVAAVPPPPAPSAAAQYIDVASQLLLSKDRNPNVVVEVAAPKVPPPFPRFYGAMDFGDGVRVVLSEKSGAPQKSYKIGDSIGDFKIRAVSRAGIDFEWDGKTLSASMADLRDAAPVIQEPTPQAAAPQTETRSGPVAIVGGSPTRPGIDIAADTKACQPGDTSPSGSVQDGYRKVVTQSPFGGSCRWERIR